MIIQEVPGFDELVEQLKDNQTPDFAFGAAKLSESASLLSNSAAQIVGNAIDPAQSQPRHGARPRIEDEAVSLFLSLGAFVKSNHFDESYFFEKLRQVVAALSN